MLTAASPDCQKPSAIAVVTHASVTLASLQSGGVADDGGAQGQLAWPP